MRLKALLLAFVLLSSIIAQPVFAIDANVADTDFNTAKSFLGQLGIIDGINKNADEQITRAEFVAMLVRSMNVGTTQTSETIFTDLEGNPFTAEIYMARNLCITNGTSETTFSPDDGVLSETAAKMVVTALGYSLPAQSYGGYPTGYLRVSQSLNLFDGVLNNEGALNLRDSFIIIYNTLLADVAFSNVDNEIGTNPGKNLLTENFRLSHISGVLTTAGFYAVNPDYAGEGVIEISGRVLKTDINAESYFGQNVSVWYDADSKQVRVILPNTLNKIETINAKDVTSFLGNILTVENDNFRQKKYTMDSSLTFVQNGRVVAHDSDSFSFEDGTLKLIDNNGDSRYDYVIAEKFEYFVISAINTHAIYDVNSAYKCIDFDTDSSKSYTIELNGAPANITELEKEMVLEVIMSEDGDICRVRGTGANTLHGTIDEIGDNEITVKGTVYSLNTYFQNLSIPLSAGKEYNFLIAPNGSITSISGISADSANYGYLLGYAGRQGLSQGPAIKVLTSADEKEIYYLADKLRLNGTPVKNDNSQIETLLTNGEFPKYQVIRYKLSDGKITMLDTETSSTTSWNPGNNYDDSDYLTKYANKTKVTYRSNVGFGIPNIAFKNSVVFSVPEKLLTAPAAKYDDELFTCTGTSKLVNDKSYTADAYDFDKNYLPACTVVYNAAETVGIFTPGTGATAYMVCGVSDAVNSEKEVTKLIKVFDSGVFSEFYVKPEFVEAFKTAKLIPGPGDVVRFVFDKKNQISGIAIDVDYDESAHGLKVNYGTASVSTSPDGYLSYFTGNALAQTVGYLVIRKDNAPDAPSAYVGNIVNLTLGTVKYTIFDKASGQVRAGTSSDIITENEAGALDAVNVACKTQYYSVNRIYIYR